MQFSFKTNFIFIVSLEKNTFLFLYLLGFSAFWFALGKSKFNPNCQVNHVYTSNQTGNISVVKTPRIFIKSEFCVVLQSAA